jgi:hypothetical protein
MTDEEIFDLADQYGWQDDFGRWNFKDDGLIKFALALLKAEQQPYKKLSEYVAQTSNGRIHIDPVTGNLGIRNPEQQSADETAHCCREWVGLTDEEIKALPSWWPSYDQMPALMRLVRDIEAKLKEKNS